MKNILIIEDDLEILPGLKTALKAEFFNVVIERDGIAGFENAAKNVYDIIILDLMLPGKNGIDICKELRNNQIQTPIIMLTARKEEIDKIVGLEIGADDYITKPFSVRELIARVKAVLRRNADINFELDEYNFADVYINFKNQEAIKNGLNVKLSTMEFKLLKYFIHHEGEVVDRNNLLDEVWGYENYPSTRTVDNFISSLRKKVEDDPHNPGHLITVFGAGYKFVK